MFNAWNRSINCSNTQQKIITSEKKKGCSMHGFKEQRHRINWHDGIKIHICYFTETNIDVFYLILCFTLYNHYCPFMISSTFLVPTIKYSKVQLSFCSLKFTIKNFLNIANNWRFNILTNKDKRWTTRIPTPQKRQIQKKNSIHSGQV